MLEGHFILTSGLRSPVFIQKARVFMYPDQTEQLCRALAEKVRAAGFGEDRPRSSRRPSAASSPATRPRAISACRRSGSSARTASSACRRFEIAAERAGARRRGHRHHRPLHPRDASRRARASAPRWSAAACLIDRSGGEADVGVPLVALASYKVPAYPRRPASAGTGGASRRSSPAAADWRRSHAVPASRHRQHRRATRQRSPLAAARLARSFHYFGSGCCGSSGSPHAIALGFAAGRRRFVHAASSASTSSSSAHRRARSAAATSSPRRSATAVGNPLTLPVHLVVDLSSVGAGFVHGASAHRPTTDRCERLGSQPSARILPILEPMVDRRPCRSGRIAAAASTMSSSPDPSAAFQTCPRASGSRHARSRAGNDDGEAATSAGDA